MDQKGKNISCHIRDRLAERLERVLEKDGLTKSQVLIQFIQQYVEDREKHHGETGMVKIVNGVRYNTGKAERILFVTNGLSSSDFNYRYKTLYRTYKGNWFIHHEAGALSDMSVIYDRNNFGESEEIEPIKEEEAYAFLQQHHDVLGADKYIEKYFSDDIEDA